MEKKKTFNFEKHVLSDKGCHAITCLNKAEINIVAAATMMLAWVTYLPGRSFTDTDTSNIGPSSNFGPM